MSKQKAQIDKLNTYRDYVDAIKKIDIDNNRQKHGVKILLKELETEVIKCSRNCEKCAYRDYETCGCWYMMTHNSGIASTRLKKKKISNKCKHFVDALKFIEEKEKSKWQNQ